MAYLTAMEVSARGHGISLGMIREAIYHRPMSNLPRTTKVQTARIDTVIPLHYRDTVTVIQFIFQKHKRHFTSPIVDSAEEFGWRR
jgi:hypothetical protein